MNRNGPCPSLSLCPAKWFKYYKRIIEGVKFIGQVEIRFKLDIELAPFQKGEIALTSDLWNWINCKLNNYADIAGRGTILDRFNYTQLIKTKTT